MAGARKKLIDLFQKNVGKPLGKELLSETAAVFDWARVIRSLRQEGYDLSLLNDGKYILNSLSYRDIKSK
jgi:hypothetical protein